jgi:hypothetical protein
MRTYTKRTPTRTEKKTTKLKKDEIIKNKWPKPTRVSMSNLQPRSWDQIKQIERKKMMKPISEQVQYCRRIKLKTNQLIIKRTEKK